MTDSGECYGEDENKVKIEETSINIDYVKNEPKEEALDSEDGTHTNQYRITLEYENMFGESSHKRKFEEAYNNLIGFLDNDVIMENAIGKLEDVKEEDGFFDSVHCSKCKGNYKGFCLKCSTLSHILNNVLLVKSELNTLPTDILEIRETSMGKRAFLLQTLPINVIFGPFEGILRIDSTVEYCWKIKDNQLMNFETENWMKNIVCAASASLKNLDIFQIHGILYFQSNREITEGEELLIYFDDNELQPLVIGEEYLYTPQKQEKLPKIFACTLCCLGFGSNKCLMEHKTKCTHMDYSRNIQVFELIECHYCKMWMEKWEHEEYHVAYCLQKHHRRKSNYSEAVCKSEMDVEEIEDDCGREDDKKIYERDMCLNPNDRTDSIQFEIKDYHYSSEANLEPLIENRIEKKHKCSECSYQTDIKHHLNRHINTHRGIKPFECDFCFIKFTEKGSLTKHIKNKHAENVNVKRYKCSECSHQTNYKSDFQRHLNKHRGIKEFKCDICIKKFTGKGSLKEHIKNKHVENRSAKRYKCSQCCYQANYKSHFQSHLDKHKGIKQFKCDICTMKFTEKGSLMKHIKNKHAENRSAKDFKCSECSYETNNKSDFKRHLNKHRGIKQFKCDICVMKFTEKGSLMRHIKNKHAENGRAKDYTCLECSFQTNYKSDFQRHLNKHRGIKPFECDICKQRFTLKGNLKIHIERNHTKHINTYTDIKPFK